MSHWYSPSGTIVPGFPSPATLPSWNTKIKAMRFQFFSFALLFVSGKSESILKLGTDLNREKNISSLQPPRWSVTNVGKCQKDRQTLATKNWSTKTSGQTIWSYVTNLKSATVYVTRCRVQQFTGGASKMKKLPGSDLSMEDLHWVAMSTSILGLANVEKCTAKFSSNVLVTRTAVTMRITKRRHLWPSYQLVLFVFLLCRAYLVLIHLHLQICVTIDPRRR